MKKQGTFRLALAVFAFGLSFSFSSVAAFDWCAACENDLQRCLDANIKTDQQCYTTYFSCMRRGDGQGHPCPL
ncbi:MULTISPECIES: hypothetical protein [Lysobacter]|uniref:Uncharacterized protein n=2 Tax=Lysobacter TaxID=68 RepID=A0A0S2DG01_LYSEN|nr:MULTISPECIES: hypothetical protein [Lysobacter]ALN57294.1 hypothetical protein GLE_1943 [Lysobacter enzymogenes]QCW25929.1 hypothetical protein FE772_09885 [Lysobacter enzymogenes]QQP99510.1 hypothetical protein JHW41_15440 [Lysobacter enzymogenes]UZW58956.1 hypothetical protein BV903_016775 [Lysobacter enzymogenes]WMT02683.1 hypothetical protein RDV84_22400 [Lysobacter yananisis]